MKKILLIYFLLLNFYTSFSQNLYPSGNKFPLGLYSLHTDLESAHNNYWNHGHRYNYRIDNMTFIASPMPDSYFIECLENNLYSMARLSSIDSLGVKWAPKIQTTINEILQQEKHQNISWWDIPEELRYWEKSEYNILKEYPKIIREFDSKKRPIYMYIPGRYNEKSIEYYVPFLDILPASCYPTYHHLPNIYIRWSIERTKEAVLNQGYKLGQDYINNEKTIIAVLELFEQEEKLTKEGTWHDFWLALACDVKGIQVFSHFYRNASLSLIESWEKLNQAVKIFKEAQLDKAILFGKDINLRTKIIAGPILSPSFNLNDKIHSYSSIKILAKEFNDTTYIIVVNSANDRIIYEINDIAPLIINSENILSGDISEIKDQTLKDTLNSLEVSLFKFYTDKSKVSTLIYPSPTRKHVSIRIIDSKITFDKIKIYTINGELIQEDDCDYCIEKKIKLKENLHGPYIIQLLRNKEHIASNKFIILD